MSNIFFGTSPWLLTPSPEISLEIKYIIHLFFQMNIISTAIESPKNYRMETEAILGEKVNESEMNLWKMDLNPTCINEFSKNRDPNQA